MNTSLSTFLKIAITSVCIGIFLFAVAYSLLDTESNEYQQYMEDHRVTSTS